MSMNLSRDNSS